VIGVVEDFHQSSLHHPIEPQMFILRSANNLVVKIGEDVPAAMNHLEKTWAQLFPNTPFAYRFLDDQLQDGYEADKIRGRIFFSFSLLTIFIAFLGLFGLASYLARQRVREVGIRKVLGASRWDVVLLMTKDFILLVVIAAVPAFVTAWYIISQWLENFAARTDTNFLLFGLILLFTLLLTFITTGLHALKAAQLNPVETLK
jgi:putative ABC transport system permease protein